MTTTSANIATVVKPIGMVQRGFRYGSGRIYPVSEIVPRKKNNTLGYGQVGMIRVESVDSVRHIGEGITEPYGKKKNNVWIHKKTKKIGVWRTIRGRRYFFPFDGSKPTPDVKGGDAPKKKGLLAKILGIAGIGVGKKKKPSSAKTSKTKHGKALGKSGKALGKAEKATRAGLSGEKGYEDTLKKTREMIKKASKSKGGKAVVGPLKAMEKALQDDDYKGFMKAQKALKKASVKLAKRKGLA